MTAGLPTTPEGVTAQWLSDCLPEREVAAVEVDHVIGGSTTKVFVVATLGDGQELRLCVKGVFDEPRAPVRVMAAQQEACFFRDLAPTLDMPLFRSWWAGADEDQGIVVFDDLRDTGTAFTPVAAAWTPDQAARALEVQATWHAATWDFPADRHDWLASGNQILRAASAQLIAEPHWSSHAADPETVVIPEAYADRERMLGAIETMFARQAEAVHALSHGDAHIGNTYIGGDGQVGFYDWQTFCLAPPLDDATYFLSGALTTEDRREYERDLLGHYLSALGADGNVPVPSFDDAWETYRSYLVHGFFWAVLPKEWQPVDVSVPLAERYLAAMDDHQTLDLLGAS